MRKGLLMIMVLGWLFGPPSIVEKATEAYNGKHYAEAAAGFGTAHDLYPGQHPALNFNTGQCWMYLDSVNKAKVWYGKVTNASKESPQMASWAWNNLGCIFGSDKAQAGAPAGAPGIMPGQAPGGMPMGAMPGMGQQAQGGDPKAGLEQALQAFKDALKLDHDNELARYNYELIKRKLQQQQQQQQQNQDQQQDQQDQKQDQQDQKQQQGQDQQKDQPQNQENKGNQGNPQQQGEGGEPQQMSAAEAERLLEAMNSNEKKFLQQIEKGKKHRTYNEDGPDW
jgi:hypothetical protein